MQVFCKNKADFFSGIYLDSLTKYRYPSRNMLEPKCDTGASSAQIKTSLIKNLRCNSRKLLELLASVFIAEALNFKYLRLCGCDQLNPTACLSQER